ncbi:hypothetical protein PV797_11685 [Clostridiaceae bacterium M8S5]|nr:hypothetical protein PV797_11685 [Clostridiaceae bacterium M8S5]
MKKLFKKTSSLEVFLPTKCSCNCYNNKAIADDKTFISIRTLLDPPGN